MGSSLVLPLKKPHRSLEGQAAFFLTIGGGLLFASTFSERAATPLQAFGAGTIGFALFLGWAALRVRYADLTITMSEDTLEIPASPLWRRELVRIPLGEIELITFAGTGDRPRVQILTRSGLWMLPFDWFPPDRSPLELGLRLHVRSQLARAREVLAPAELAALEATIIDGKSYGAYVVERLNEAPEVIATLDRLPSSTKEREELREKIKGQGARLYDCSARITALRDALERGLAAPVFRASKPAQNAAPLEETE